VAATELTLLVEDLAALAAAAPEGTRPALQRCAARGRPIGPAATDPNRIRLELFGATCDGAPPLAALSALADGVVAAGDGRYWLRIDPVTLRADMSRVFVTAWGLDDYDAGERAGLRDVLVDVLREAGHELLGEHPERGYLALPGPPGFDFVPLGAALGSDAADTLPAGPEAREWRRLLTEVQVALHHADFNQRRRREGRREANAAWIWGGGRLPDRVDRDAFVAVYSDDPVSLGLALLGGVAPRPLSDADPAAPGGGRVLVDWRTGRSGAPAELDRLEAWVARLLPAAQRGELVLALRGGDGAGWCVDRGALRRFWRRERPLREALPAAGAATP